LFHGLSVSALPYLLDNQSQLLDILYSIQYELFLINAPRKPSLMEWLISIVLQLDNWTTENTKQPQNTSCTHQHHTHTALFCSSPLCSSLFLSCAGWHSAREMVFKLVCCVICEMFKNFHWLALVIMVQYRAKQLISWIGPCTCTVPYDFIVEEFIWVCYRIR